MKIAIGSDHAGFFAKEFLKKFLADNDFEVLDFGTFSDQSCDYPDFALLVANAVALGQADKGVLICGTGIGISICANKVKGIRCGLCTNTFMAEMTRLHNDANILAMGARVTEPDEMKEILLTFLNTEFSNEEKHLRRIEKIKQIEE